MRKSIVIILALVMVLTLTACESSKISEAKDIVDELVEYTIKKLDAQIQLESATSDRKAELLQYEIELYENSIEFCMNKLDEINESLSAAGQQELQEYINIVYSEAVERYNNSK